MNLVETVLGHFSGDVVGKIASLLGEDQNRTRAAVTAAVPALLAGLASTASSTDGARKLFATLGDVDDSLLGNLGNTVSSKGSSLIDKGSGQLNSLLGGGMLSKLSSVLSKFTGLSGASIGSLLGLLGPLVLGIIKKQKNAMGLDASGLASMLAGQKQNIADAMPAGLSGMLGDVPGLSQFAGMAQRAPARTAAAARTTATAATAASRSSGSLFRWLVPLVLLAVGAWLLYSWLNSRPTTPTVPTTTTNGTPPVITTDEPLPTESTGIVDSLSSGLRDAFTTAITTINEITDAASAQAAVPKLEELTTKLESLRSSFANLSATQKTTVTTLISPLKIQLQTAIDKVMAQPGVSEAIKPTVDALMAKVNEFAA